MSGTRRLRRGSSPWRMFRSRRVRSSSNPRRRQSNAAADETAGSGKRDGHDGAPVARRVGRIPFSLDLGRDARAVDAVTFHEVIACRFGAGLCERGMIPALLLRVGGGRDRARRGEVVLQAKGDAVQDGLRDVRQAALGGVEEDLIGRRGGRPGYGRGDGLARRRRDGLRSRSGRRRRHGLRGRGGGSASRGRAARGLTTTGGAGR